MHTVLLLLKSICACLLILLLYIEYNTTVFQVIAGDLRDGLPDHALPAALFLCVRYWGENAEDALLVNATLGGDNCHRGVIVGVVFGAAGTFLSNLTSI